jgi:hypothetical protein
LDEGYRMLSNLIGIEPDEIHAGLRVCVELLPVGSAEPGEPVRALPYFRPDRAG